MEKIGRNNPCPCGSNRKYKKCCLGKKMERELLILRSERHVITVQMGEERHKLFQVFYLKDGSLCVDFPYFLDTEGIVSELTLNAGIDYPTSLKLDEKGKVTSHLVKYSHHPDGRVHFSQDGKVYTKIKRQSVPHKKLCGHVFTIMLQGFENFEKAKKEKDLDHSDPRRTVVNFKIEDNYKEALKLVGRWYSLDYFKSNVTPINLQGKTFGPQIITGSGGEYTHGFLVSSLLNNPSKDYVLTISCQKVPLLDKSGEPCLTFIGGFDDYDIAIDKNKETSFLGLSYPTTNQEQLKNTIGSIDFNEPSEKEIKSL